jgi:hypothetical protein
MIEYVDYGVIHKRIRGDYKYKCPMCRASYICRQTYQQHIIHDHAPFTGEKRKPKKSSAYYFICKKLANNPIYETSHPTYNNEYPVYRILKRKL